MGSFDAFCLIDQHPSPTSGDVCNGGVNIASTRECYCGGMQPLFGYFWRKKRHFVKNPSNQSYVESASASGCCWNTALRKLRPGTEQSPLDALTVSGVGGGTGSANTCLLLFDCF